MHSICKQDFYKDKQKKIDNLFIKYHIPIMDYLDHTAMIKEWKQLFSAADYGNNLNQDVNIPSVKK